MALRGCARRCATAARRLAAAVIVLVGTGCEMSEAVERLAQEATPFAGQSAAEGSAALAGPAEPDMESIGPEQSKRIYYQFLDDGGTVQFVERLSDVPEAWRDRVGYVEMDQAPPLTPLEARRTWKLSAARAAEITLAASRNRAARDGSGGKRRMDDFQPEEDVILYSATWCGYCTKARRHLDREGVDYEIRDVDRKSGQSRAAREDGARWGARARFRWRDPARLQLGAIRPGDPEDQGLSAARASYRALRRHPPAALRARPRSSAPCRSRWPGRSSWRWSRGIGSRRR